MHRPLNWIDSQPNGVLLSWGSSPVFFLAKVRHAAYCIWLKQRYANIRIMPTSEPIDRHSKKKSNEYFWAAWIIFATSDFVLPLTDTLSTPMISSPLCNVPSFEAAVLSNIYSSNVMNKRVLLGLHWYIPERCRDKDSKERPLQYWFRSGWIHLSPKVPNPSLLSSPCIHSNKYMSFDTNNR